MLRSIDLLKSEINKFFYIGVLSSYGLRKTTNIFSRLVQDKITNVENDAPKIVFTLPSV
jgi:hypothetical protein